MSFAREGRPSSARDILKSALEDIVATLLNLRLVTVFGWQDIRQRYRRSVIGPFWITISMAVMITALGVVFGTVLKSPMDQYLPFLTLGLIFWSYISTMIQDGTTVFTSVERIIRQMPIPFFVYVLRTYWRNTIILAHNILIFPAVCVVVGKSLTFTSLLAIPGFLLVSVNLLWITLVIGIVCTRFRDCVQIVNSFLQIVFYVSPIIWMPSALPDRGASMILNPNPVYHMLCLIRDPFLGIAPNMVNWMIPSLMAMAGWGIALLLLGRSRGRIAFWL